MDCPQGYEEVIDRNLCRHPFPPYCPKAPKNRSSYCEEHHKLYWMRAKQYDDIDIDNFIKALK